MHRSIKSVARSSLYGSTLVDEEMVATFSGSPPVAPSAPLAFAAVTVTLELLTATVGALLPPLHPTWPAARTTSSNVPLTNRVRLPVGHSIIPKPSRVRLPNSGKPVVLGITADSGIIAA